MAVDKKFRQDVIDVLQELGMMIGDNIDVVNEVDDKVTLPGVEFDDKGNPLRYVAAKMSIFMKPALDAAEIAERKGNEAEQKGNEVKQKGDAAEQQGNAAQEKGNRAQSIYETVNAWWPTFKSTAETFYNSTMLVTWQNWYNTFKDNAERWWQNYPGAIEEWYALIKPEIENWFADQKSAWNTWFGANANAGVRKTWSDWFSDSLATGTRKIWNDWWASVQASWNSWTRAETARANAETTRNNNEEARKQAETARANAETQRNNNEQVRLDGTWRQNLETGKWEKLNQRTGQWEDTGTYWLGGLIAYRFYTDPKTGRIHIVKNNNDRVNPSLQKGRLKVTYVG